MCDEYEIPLNHILTLSYVIVSSIYTNIYCSISIEVGTAERNYTPRFF